MAVTFKITPREFGVSGIPYVYSWEYENDGYKASGDYCVSYRKAKRAVKRAHRQMMRDKRRFGE